MLFSQKEGSQTQIQGNGEFMNEIWHVLCRSLWDDEATHRETSVGVM